ncbi:autotransporter outer membrane beta-barrel domain-containing protein [Scandinavium sp.]|uniref:autotransporter outer membrane beta-barrel domain-containing protein n=1 Tax=Scandinavium sp. TaxID=2830653 RepID=UPI00289BA390|nr:autotransporter outer membrane beta-barrel domain-containing protein [Scandinavium sp.]
MKPTCSLSFLTSCICLALTSGQVWATCNETSPTNGQTVTCDATTPESTSVVSGAAVTNVTVNVLPSGELNVTTGPAISLGDGSKIANDGTISGSTSGLLLREGSSTVTNNGSITGTAGPGVMFQGSGGNTLNNNGTITGRDDKNNAVIFGSGNDTLSVGVGSLIDGNVDQDFGSTGTSGSGNDTFTMDGGTIRGTVDQGVGPGVDRATITGGTIEGDFRQGGGRDTFEMSGGTITGEFNDGDIVTITGGTIGSVALNLGNDDFRMSGGEILGDVKGQVNNDSFNISGTAIVDGNILGGIGDDRLVWQNGGTIKGSILMDGDPSGDKIGNDEVTLINQSSATTASSPVIDGGAGTDRFTLDNSQYIHRDANILSGFESVNLTNNSTLTLDHRDLKLGDSQDDNASTGFTIDATSTLAIDNDNAVAFTGHLSGTGTVSTDTSGNAFDFTSNNKDDGFEGTLALGNSTLALEGINTEALSNATLKAGAGSVTTVGSGQQHIGGLAFDGGTVIFGSVAPGEKTSDNTIQTAKDLDLSGSGTVQVDLGDAVNTPPQTDGRVPLLEQDDGDTLIRLSGSDGTVTGTGGALELKDSSGNVISSGKTQDILDRDGGSKVAEGTWDWRLTSGDSNDGLYVAYALKEVNLIGQGNSALVLNSGSSTGNAADLSAKVTGSGDLAIDTGSGTVSLSNRSNDYTGVTDVRSGTLLMSNDNVLGQTSLLKLADSTGLAMSGHAQTVGAVDTAAGSLIDIAGGSLGINNGGTVNGHLQGAGALTLNGGELTINGANTAMTATTTLKSGSTINLDSVQGLGSGNIDNGGVLNLNGAAGTFANNLSNSGQVNLNSSQTVLAGDNRGFSGEFNIDNASRLTAGQASHLGQSVIHDEGTLALVTDSNWSLENAVSGAGNLVKEGAGLVTLAAQNMTYTGTTDITGGGLIFGDRGSDLTLSSSQVNIAEGGLLAGNGTAAGSVDNKGLLQVGHAGLVVSAAARQALAATLATVSSNNDALTVGGNLTNSGQIQLGQTGSDVLAGNSLTVNGNYLGEGGKIAFNTALGDDSSLTDHMTVMGDTSGNTLVSVRNAGGSGARTLNGIEIISVEGNSAGTFTKDGRIVAGAWDYNLERGKGGASDPDNWYLTNNAPTQPVGPTNPTEHVNPGTPMYRVEAGSYIANVAAANTLFVTRLHDRLGETQYTDALTGEKRVTSLWLRQVGTHNTWRDSTGQQKTQSNQYVVMLGGDVAQWSSDGLDRGHLGLMAGYGNNHSNTRSDVTGYHSDGRVSGYNVGVYGTWYANDAEKTGLYVDSWASYSWLKNTVNGEDLAREEYDSKGLTASLESGYTWKVGEFNGSKGTLNTVYIQPQAQAIWMGVSADDHTESNGTHVSSNGDGNVQTRLGVRTYLKSHSRLDDGKDREFEPFVEANWIHNTRDFSVTMNNVTLSQSGARNLGELKTGVEGKLSNNLTAWGNVGQQIGDKGYSNTEAMLGVKYSW